MIQSMTGFGDASRAQTGVHYAAEVKSLNNRFFKPTIRVPEFLSSLEPRVESLLRERVGRGSIYFTLRVTPDAAGDPDRPYVNAGVLRHYAAELQAAGFAVTQPELLLTLPGVIIAATDGETSAVPPGDVEEHRTTAMEVAEAAVVALLSARRAEGAALARDLMAHLDAMASHVAAVAERGPRVIDVYHDRLTQRVNELLSKAELSVGREELLREVAVFAERSDISEELSRLAHHVEQFRETVVSLESSFVGRKLDFIAQEMLREANTIGSKAQDAEVAGRVIELKGLIDRVKEQVQNVE